MLDDVRPPDLPERPDRPKPKLRLEPLPKPEQPPLHEQAKAADPTFVTPEEIAAYDEAADTAPVVSSGHDAPRAKTPKSIPKSGSKHRFHFSWPPSRKQAIIGGVLAVVLAFGLGAGWTLTHQRRTIEAAPPKHTVVKKTTPKPTIYSTLSGLPVPDASVNQRPVTAVMIENSIDARPQSGLATAGVVFEAVAEGGVTRFMALYQDTAPDNVGPIRSARPYFVSWAMGFDAAYAHVGGSPDALADISAWGTKDMNQFSNGGSYHRIHSRAAPHNVYTAISTLNQLEARKGYTSSFTGFARKSDQPYKAAAAGAQASDVRTPATSLNFSLSGYTYDPHFAYNASTNSYDRSEAGDPHIDTNGNQRISPKVVIAMVVPLSRGALDATGAYYSDYSVIGDGTAYVFQDGTVATANWHKASNSGPLTFTDVSGQPFALNRGQTWITAVSGTSRVTYK